MSESTAAIVGVASTELGADERTLLREHRPWGLILFARNCVAPGQVSDLVAAYRDAVGRADAAVLIDQEGGRVTRLKPPVWPAIPAARLIGRLAEYDRAPGLEAAWLWARSIAAQLEPLGVTVDCVPVLDLAHPGQTDAIGDRAFAPDPALVGLLGQAAIEGLLDGGVLPVIKHLPGHGRAEVDSHETLPTVAASREALATTDWQPFRDCAGAPLAITAHVRYPALDPDLPATLSPTIIAEVIRGAIGFEGVLMTDDLSMGALRGSVGERAAAARAAGCDLALHCNGDFGEMVEVLRAAGALIGEPAARAERALARRRPATGFDPEAARRRLAELLAAVAPPVVASA